MKIAKSRGAIIARLLAGTWRSTPPALVLELADILKVLPQVLQTGAGALAWAKVRHSSLANAPELQPLHDAYQTHRLEAFLQENRLNETLAGLSWSGALEPILAKGWAIARLYPEPGLRPFGDFDLCIHPSYFQRALEALKKTPDLAEWIDLHEGLPELPDREYPEAFRRSEKVNLGETTLRILGPEDHLRLLCLHFARHGGWRPLWLCDVAAFVENLPAGFDWEYFRSGSPRLTAWVQGVVGLAGRLLGARIESLPEFASQPNGEFWMDESVLKEWGQSQPGDSHSRDQLGIARQWNNPWRFLRGLRQRTPNPLEAAVRLGADPKRLPWLPWLQFRFWLRRGTGFARRFFIPRPEAAGPIHLAGQ